MNSDPQETDGKGGTHMISHPVPVPSRKIL